MKLSDFELEVMQVMWNRGPSTAPEVHQTIEPNHKVAYSTVKTIIDRLEEKGALRRARTYGRTILYETSVEREELSRPMVRSFINKVFSGNVRPLFSHILQDEEMSLEDVSYLEEIIKAKKEGMSK